VIASTVGDGLAVSSAAAFGGVDFAAAFSGVDFAAAFSSADAFGSVVGFTAAFGGVDIAAVVGGVDIAAVVGGVDFGAGGVHFAAANAGGADTGVGGAAALETGALCGLHVSTAACALGGGCATPIAFGGGDFEVTGLSDMMWPSLLGGGGGGPMALYLGDSGVSGGTSGHNSGTLRVDGSGGTHTPKAYFGCWTGDAR